MTAQTAVQSVAAGSRKETDSSAARTCPRRATEQHRTMRETTQCTAQPALHACTRRVTVHHGVSDSLSKRRWLDRSRLYAHARSLDAHQDSARGHGCTGTHGTRGGSEPSRISAAHLSAGLYSHPSLPWKPQTLRTLPHTNLKLRSSLRPLLPSLP